MPEFCLMTATPQVLKIRRPDDWHIHLRDDEMLSTVLPFTSEVFGRAIVMPNLTPPVTTVAAAIAYRERIMAALPAGHKFTPLMTCYLTDSLDPKEIASGFEQGVFTAAKLYPANATTNSQHGVSDVKAIYPVLERMQKIGMPLLIHGEVTHSHVDIFDREARFIDEVMDPVRRQFPELKIVFEHITTKEAAQYVLSGNQYLGATITPQHLMFNRNHMLVGGVRPHLFCLPILKRNVHQEALREVIASGADRFFLGTDSAPHTKGRKESSCGCAGCFNAPLALSAYATVFEEMNALQNFEAFCSLNGPRFYGLPLNEDFIELTRTSVTQPEEIALGNESVVPFLAGHTLNWKVTSY
jgi:dihydroorotase